jgi:hypothetical protein
MNSSRFYDEINRAALCKLPMLLARWLPKGRKHGCRWVALNPTRGDRHIGSFSVDMRTGQWGEFSSAAPARGGDVVSLYAYLRGVRQGEAARELAELLRVKP